jgi:hypothetical protein
VSRTDNATATTSPKASSHAATLRAMLTDWPSITSKSTTQRRRDPSPRMCSRHTPSTRTSTTAGESDGYVCIAIAANRRGLSRLRRRRPREVAVIRERRIPPELQRLANSLRSDLDEITAQCVEVLMSEAADYAREGQVSRDDLWRSCHDNLASIFAYMASISSCEPDYSPARATGARRAEQRFPLETVLHAFRVGGRIIWQNLVAAARRHDDQASIESKLFDSATEIWDLIDEFASVVAASYREREVVLRQTATDRRIRALERLLLPDGIDSRGTDSLENELGIPESTLKTIVVVRAREPWWAPPKRWGTDGVIWRLGEEFTVGLVPSVGQNLEAQAASLLDERVKVGASSPFQSYSRTFLAFRWAKLASRCTGFGEFALIDSVLPDALLVNSPALGRRIQAAVAGSVDSGEGIDAQTLSTVAHYIATGRSPTKTGEICFCHRNTVHKRVSAFARTTGIDVTSIDGQLLTLLAYKASLQGSIILSGSGEAV